MAQADYSIANQGFPATRADINSHLEAIATNNSGTSAPSTQYAGQFWIDTTTSTWTMYIHDGADDIQFATIDTSANTVNFIDSALASDVVINTSGDITTTGAFTSVGIDDNATSTAITIDGSERVGIGTTSPASLLELEGTSTTAKIHINSTSAGASSFDGSGAGLLLTAGGMNTTSKFTPAIQFGSTDTELTTTNPKVGAAINAIARESYTSDTDGGMALAFYTTPNNPGTGQTTTERMRIDSSGNLFIAATSFSSGSRVKQFEINANTIALKSSSATTAFQYHQEFHNPNGFIGSITTSGSATAFNTSSDYRLKENVNYDFDATTRLKQLRPARFNFIADANTIVDGFLAHEVQDIVPEAISGEKDAMKTEEYEVTPAVLDEDGNVITEAVMGTREVPDYQGIDQSKLVPLLVKTIQELEARITELENK